jgi:peptidyl-tRNA hydrolase, PTH1 family
VIRLVVGLGNPGKEYERTRHNAGFWLVERFAAANGVALRKDPKYQALVGRMEGSAWLLLPQSFMNSSGRAVQMLAGFFKIKPEEILVVHDELDFPPGTARIKQGGGIAGHNGLKDISQRIGSHDYWRLRLGVGRPRCGRLRAAQAIGGRQRGDRRVHRERARRAAPVHQRGSARRDAEAALAGPPGAEEGTRKERTAEEGAREKGAGREGAAQAPGDCAGSESSAAKRRQRIPEILVR